MPDIFLWPGAASTKDITLRDPTTTGGTAAKSDTDTAASMADAALTIFAGAPDDPLSLNDVATIVALLTPAEAMTVADAAALLAIAGVGESITTSDAATLVSLFAPDDAGTVADAATLIGLAVSESAAVVEAVSALVVIGPDDLMAVDDQPAIIAIGTPNEDITVIDAVADLLQFQSVGPIDEVFSILDAVLSIVEIEIPPTILPAFGGAPADDGQRRIAQKLQATKLKRTAIDYEPAPLPETWAFPYPPDIAGQKYVRLNNRIGDLLALYMMGLIDFDELNAMAAVAA